MLPLHRILLVRENMVGIFLQRIITRYQPAEHTVCGKAHVILAQHHGLGHADSLLTGRFHVKAGFALPMGTEHTVIIGPGRHHCAQPLAQDVRFYVGRPRPHRVPFVIQHADKRIGQIAHSGRGIANVRPLNCPRFR